MIDLSYYTTVYLRGRKIAHLMTGSPNSSSGTVLCNQMGSWWDPHPWHGTGSQAEIDLAASLPTCKRCLKEA